MFALGFSFVFLRQSYWSKKDFECRVERKATEGRTEEFTDAWSRPLDSDSSRGSKKKEVHILEDGKIKQLEVNNAISICIWRNCLKALRAVLR